MSESNPQPQPSQPDPAQDAAPGPASAEEKTLDKLLAEAEARIAEQREAWLRAVAEADNVRKRARADVAAAHKFAVERFAESLLPVTDSLEAALAAAEGAPQALRDGIELTLRQLRAAFEKASITEIVAAPGERFDPHRHQAMAAVESAGEPNTVVEAMQKGYRIHDRVLRPALVTVAKAVESAPRNPISDTGLDSN